MHLNKTSLLTTDPSRPPSFGKTCRFFTCSRYFTLTVYMFAQVSNATIFPRYPQIAFAGLNMRCPCSIRGKKVWAGPWTHAETRPKADLEKQIADNTIRHLFQLKEVGVPHPIDAQQTQSSRRRKKKIGNIKYKQFTKKRKQKREEK